ncbi:MAG: adenosylhomocysteinase [Thermoleophilia bacterium]|nr:adenosylhomocysteinase [Thermoleophilia bacterium]
MAPGGAARASRIADLSLAEAGEQKIRWVARHSPVLNRLARERLADGALRGRRVAVVVHLEAKTAYLATLLAEAGAEVVVAGSNPRSTQDSVAAALVTRGLRVFARHGSSRAEFTEDLLALVDTRPEIIVDDGAEATTRIVEHRAELAPGLRGVSEETTTGLARLRALARAGRLPFPAVAANDAACKHLFDNRYGTAQATMQAILRLTNLAASGKHFCVVGYGYVGKGLASYAEGLGGRVTVVEVDPVAALQAFMDGHRVASRADALPDADIVVTATGGIEALAHDDFALLKDGVVLANAGHHDREIDVRELEALAGPGDLVRPGVTRFRLGGRRIHLLVGGALVNIAGLDGNPIEIMDLSFSVQALSAHYLAANRLKAGIHPFPPELDRAIATAKLTTLGIELDELRPSQRAFSEQWSVWE